MTHHAQTPDTTPHAANRAANQAANRTTNHATARTTNRAANRARSRAAHRAANRGAALLLAGVGALCALCATGCGQVGEALGTSSDRYATACAVVIDGSGSGQEGPEGFDAEEKLNTALPRFLQDRECRTLAFAPITLASEFSDCQQETLDLDPDAEATDDREEVRAAWRAVAAEQARDLLACARRQQPAGSDVLGALDRISHAAPGGDEPFDVLVVSDFIQWDRSFQLRANELTTAESRTAAIDELADQGRLPGLPDTTTVFPSGYGMRFSDDPAEYEGFDAFWTELLEERVNTHVSFDYRQ
ncbi:hypothetical protein [Streptomyces sp. B6B3]|uniref:hypothetical protein n=1 Tax=Streptomyces sp. B6B3 TaxID=3153570 RepID=UPI00325D9E5E